MDNITRLFNAQTDHAWDLFLVQRKLDEAAALSKRLLLEPQLSDANQATLHTILTYTEDNAVKHATLALEPYRGLYEDPETTEEAREALKKAIEVAEEDLVAAREWAEDGELEVGDEGDNEVMDEVDEADDSMGDKTSGSEEVSGNDARATE